MVAKIGRVLEVLVAVGAVVVLITIVVLELLVAIKSLYVRAITLPSTKRDGGEESMWPFELGNTDLLAHPAGMVLLFCVLP